MAALSIQLDETSTTEMNVRRDRWIGIEYALTDQYKNENKIHEKEKK